MTTHQKILCGLLLLCSGLVSASQFAEPLRVVLVLSDNNALTQSFARTYRQNLPNEIALEVLTRAEDFVREPQGADMIVTVGVKAANWVADRSMLPLLAAMIPSNSYPQLRAQRQETRQTSAIYLDQPWARQAGLLHAVMPERHKIGVVYSAAARLDVAALRVAISEQGGHLNAKQTDESLFAGLESVIEGSEVLLAVPDSTIYNSNTIRNILLSSYRRGIPLVGFSAAYVKAGALCAIYSTPEHLAEQAAAATLSFARTHKLSEAQFPALYSIAVNQEVARTLGITLSSTESLREQIEKSSRSLR